METQCNLCKEVKNIENFYLRSNGKPRKECKSCFKIIKSKYYTENKDRIKQQTQKYKKFNPEKIKQESIEYYKNNKEKIRLYQKDYINSPHGRLINLMHSAQTRSKNKDFDLDIDFLVSLYENQNGKCLLTGIPFSFNKPINYRSDPFSVSIDKINPKLHYTKNNVRLVCVAINYALNEFGEQTFKQISESYLKKLSSN